MAENEAALPGAEEVEGQEQQPVRPLPSGPPYDAKRSEEIRNFFKRRKKDPSRYTFSKQGDLEILVKGETSVEGTIQLKQFVPLTPEERDLREQTRLDAMTAFEEEYEVALTSLRAAWESGEKGKILELNQRITEIDQKRNLARSALRSITDIQRPTIRDILFDQPYETRKHFDLAQLTYRNFTLQNFYGKYLEVEEAAPAIKEAATKAAPAFVETDVRKRLRDGRIARIFFEETEATNGFLSPMWPVEFTLDSTRYFTALQAYEAERAKELKMEKLRTDILNTRKPRTIRILTKKVVGHPADARGLWMRIFTAVYQQHPDLLVKLQETGSDSLVYADPREGPSGVALSDKDSGLVDPAKWKGENLVGIALETVRTRSREQTLEEAAEGPVTEGVITEEQQAQAKTAAIINAARNRKKFGPGGT